KFWWLYTFRAFQTVIAITQPSVLLPCEGCARPRSPTHEFRERQCNDFSRLVQIRERQPLVGAVGVGFLDRMGAGAVKQDRNAWLRTVPGVRIERDAGGRDLFAHDAAPGVIASLLPRP